MQVVVEVAQVDHMALLAQAVLAVLETEVLFQPTVLQQRLTQVVVAAVAVVQRQQAVMVVLVSLLFLTLTAHNVARAEQLQPTALEYHKLGCIPSLHQVLTLRNLIF